MNFLETIVLVPKENDYSFQNVHRKWLVFLSNLASAAKQQSFSRAGLMGLAECIVSAASRVSTYDNESEAYRDEDAFAGKAQLEFNSENFPQNEKIVLLDALRFIIESSKQHFNPNYRLQGLKSLNWLDYSVFI